MFSMRPYLPSKDLPGGFNGLEWSKSFRAHGPILADLLDDYWERTAETCNRFENISKVDKYSIICTVCLHFEEKCCSPDFVGPSMVKLLKASYKHDGLTWP